jgi:hypothetical protein
MRQRRQRVPEENQKIYASFGDSCANLLVAAEGSAFEDCDFAVKFFLQHLAGRSSSA